MRIAVLAPLCETVPPLKYGGTERVVSWLVEKLVQLGHDVTLYAAAGSRTSGKFISCGHGLFRERDLRDDSNEAKEECIEQLKAVFFAVEGFDVVHIHHTLYAWHPGVLERILESTQNTSIIWTDHNEIGKYPKPRILKRLGELGIGFTALSESHRSTVPVANWLATIHHGLPIDQYTPSKTSPSYLAFLGRISPEKGIIEAVKIAETAGLKLKVAAKVDPGDKEFYETQVKPLFDKGDVEFRGEISDEEKNSFLSAAHALVFPIRWLEPFGLVMIEAMACGCPVIAYRSGSVLEIIEENLTGFIVETEADAVEAVQKLSTLDRKRIREYFEERFTSDTMASKYVQAYQKAIESTKEKELDESELAQEKSRLATNDLTSHAVSVLITPALSLLEGEQPQHNILPPIIPLVTPPMSSVTTAPDYLHSED